MSKFQIMDYKNNYHLITFSTKKKFKFECFVIQIPMVTIVLMFMSI